MEEKEVKEKDLNPKNEMDEFELGNEDKLIYKSYPEEVKQNLKFGKKTWKYKLFAETKNSPPICIKNNSKNIIWRVGLHCNYKKEEDEYVVMQLWHNGKNYKAVIMNTRKNTIVLASLFNLVPLNKLTDIKENENAMKLLNSYIESMTEFVNDHGEPTIKTAKTTKKRGPKKQNNKTLKKKTRNYSRLLRESEEEEEEEEWIQKTAKKQKKTETLKKKSKKKKTERKKNKKNEKEKTVNKNEKRNKNKSTISENSAGSTIGLFPSFLNSNENISTSFVSNPSSNSASPSYTIQHSLKIPEVLRFEYRELLSSQKKKNGDENHLKASSPIRKNIKDGDDSANISSSIRKNIKDGDDSVNISSDLHKIGENKKIQSDIGNSGDVSRANMKRKSENISSRHRAREENKIGNDNREKEYKGEQTNENKEENQEDENDENKTKKKTKNFKIVDQKNQGKSQTKTSEKQSSSSSNDSSSSKPKKETKTFQKPSLSKVYTKSNLSNQSSSTPSPSKRAISSSTTSTSSPPKKNKSSNQKKDEKEEKKEEKIEKEEEKIEKEKIEERIEKEKEKIEEKKEKIEEKIEKEEKIEERIEKEKEKIEEKVIPPQISTNPLNDDSSHPKFPLPSQNNFDQNTPLSSSSLASNIQKNLNFELDFSEKQIQNNETNNNDKNNPNQFFPSTPNPSQQNAFPFYHPNFQFVPPHSPLMPYGPTYFVIPQNSPRSFDNSVSSPILSSPFSPSPNDEYSKKKDLVVFHSQKLSSSIKKMKKYQSKIDKHTKLIEEHQKEIAKLFKNEKDN